MNEYDEESILEEDWVSCDFCRKNKVQVENKHHAIEYLFVNRRMVHQGDDSIEAVVSRCIERNICWQKLCFTCFIASHGAEKLGAMGILGWVDQRREYDSPLPREDEKKWEQDFIEQQEALDRRELQWLERNEDMFPPDP